MSEIREYYTAVAQQFADDCYSNENLLPILKQFVSMFKKRPRILDLGCNAGYESMRLNQLGASVVGIDFCEEAINIAREKNPDCIFKVMDFKDLDESLGLFDGVVAFASFIHICDSELGLIFENLSKVVTSDGLMMIAIVEGEGISKERSILEHNKITYNRTFYLHSLERLNEIALGASFKFVEEILLPDIISCYDWKCFLYRKE